MNTTTQAPAIIEVHELTNDMDQVRCYEVVFEDHSIKQISWEAFQTASLITGITEDMFLEFPNMSINLINQVQC